MQKSFFYLAIFVLAVGCNGSEKKPEPTSAAIGCASATTDKAWYSAGIKAPRLNGLEGIDFKISTNSREAQAYFNQGMMLSYGFNHAEAARSFFEATRLDSNCAMAYWGFAYVLGPNYNAGMEDDNYQRAYQAAQKAQSLAGNCTAKEKALITALQSRYAPEPPADRKALDIAFAGEMKKVYTVFPDDPDISALYAESIMDMHPWDLYYKKTKAPKPWTPEIVAILEKLIKQYPRHPGAPHFYIHAVEASDKPERAFAAANLLMTLVPGSGHLVHMPSHIYIWTGDYHLGSLANIAAVKADSSYITSCHAQGAYPLAYYPHNYHYLAATATFEGNSRLAWDAAKTVQEKTAKDVMIQPGWGTLQHYYSVPYFVAVKFALWDSILAINALNKDLVYPRAILHYARGLAFLGKKAHAKAENELAMLKGLAKDTSLKLMNIWNINTMSDIVQIAVHVLTAEIHRNKKEFDKAFGEYTKAIAIEDNLNYNEPPDWFFSVRHQLGNALLQAGRYAEAQKIYEEDLRTWKENGWALIGLYEALRKQGRSEDAVSVKKRFDKAWQYADYDIAGLFRYG
ncbi:tetratricopeptide repeat protein [Sediminibacterium ginsengisoli]|uniref:Tetratricopeptide repeat-containing protein n=1 Tax=Sediminibacterium ginsengisoli TaxID=413434 RepID=A0A1T4PQ58_9BACT|nr:tetratricopeptide repeat protein [Sediminibacterium ginsengisoli]SJZ93700.1 Tetratricopeptide repeat-containing protein [Sediminibacterium ginsengisoli]